jgi:hypothetical protein
MLMKFTGITVFNPIGKWSNAGMLDKGQAKGPALCFGNGCPLRAKAGSGFLTTRYFPSVFRGFVLPFLQLGGK